MAPPTAGQGGWLAMHPAKITLAAVAALALAASPAVAKTTTSAVTSGAHYDRNPVAVDDGSRDLLFFARSEEACNRLDGCNADQTSYDLFLATDKGKGFAAPVQIANNPGPVGPILWRGRTIAATRTSDGTVHVFWADGGNTSKLYHLSRGPKAASFSAPVEVPLPAGNAIGFFNVEAVAKGRSVFVYTEEVEPSALYAYRFAGGELTDRTLVAEGQSIPKAMIDKKGVFRLAMTNGSVSVASSNDGLHFSAPQVAVPATGSFTNWDPSLAQDDDGTFLLSYAPDHGDGANQHVEIAASRDFASWSPGLAVSQPAGWWDYWPEADLKEGKDTLYFVSERPVGAGAAGTGHIWSSSR